jgi:hypothetical protein
MLYRTSIIHCSVIWLTCLIHALIKGDKLDELYYGMINFWCLSKSFASHVNTLKSENIIERSNILEWIDLQKQAGKWKSRESLWIEDMHAVCQMHTNKQSKPMSNWIQHAHWHTFHACTTPWSHTQRWQMEYLLFFRLLKANVHLYNFPHIPKSISVHCSAKQTH